MKNRSIQEIQDEVIAEFAMLDDPADAQTYIMEIGKKLPDLPDEFKKEENLIKGCQAKVWLVASLDEEERLIFRADSDAFIVKGLISLLVRVLSGQSPHAVLNAELYFIEKIGLKQIITSTRSNGLTAMIKQMKLYALAFQTKLESKV